MKTFIKIRRRCRERAIVVSVLVLSWSGIGFRLITIIGLVLQSCTFFGYDAYISYASAKVARLLSVHLVSATV